MSKRWVNANRVAFIRDVMRDYCMACDVIKGQVQRFESAGAVSFPVMRDLLGEAMNKGLLWRLKDTAHHLFRNEVGAAEQTSGAAPMLDWAIGYVFHECLKLKEDAYQHQHYVPLYRALQAAPMDDDLHEVVTPLAAMLDQTRESMEREIRRISYLLVRSRKLLCIYLRAHGNNQLLARLLSDQDELVRNAFGEDYPLLIASLYGDKPECLHLQAAEALIEGGRPTEALRALDAAEATRPGTPDAARLRQQAEILIDSNAHRRATAT